LLERAVDRPFAVGNFGAVRTTEPTHPHANASAYGASPSVEIALTEDFAVSYVIELGEDVAERRTNLAQQAAEASVQLFSDIAK
jgi:hypothetical protein